VRSRKAIRETFGDLKKSERAASDALLLQVGRVVVELSNVDHVLGFMYGMLGEGAPGERWRSYAKIRSFEKKLELVNDAVKAICDAEKLALWQSAYQKLSNNRPQRNLVAHFGMRRLFTSDRRDLGVELTPPWYLPRARHRSLKLADVKRAANQIHDAKADLWDFINTIAR
jgi:hypothetical protein